MALLTDDGAYAPGPLAAVEALALAGSPTLLVGSSEARGNAGTAAYQDAVHGDEPRSTERLAERARRVIVEALPARTALLLASGAFGDLPEVVMSGVNYGPNAGFTAVHSGTLGAAYTAANLGLRAAAVSLDDVFSVDPHDPGPLQWEVAATVLRCVSEVVAGSPPGTLLNVNVPNLQARDIAGIALSELAPVTPERALLGPEPPVAGRRGPSDLPLTDVELLARGMISVTPLASFGFSPRDDTPSRIEDIRLRLQANGFFG